MFLTCISTCFEQHHSSRYFYGYPWCGNIVSCLVCRDSRGVLYSLDHEPSSGADADGIDTSIFNMSKMLGADNPSSQGNLTTARIAKAPFRVFDACFPETLEYPKDAKDSVGTESTADTEATEATEIVSTECSENAVDIPEGRVHNTRYVLVFCDLTYYIYYYCTNNTTYTTTV